MTIPAKRAVAVHVTASPRPPIRRRRAASLRASAMGSPPATTTGRSRSSTAVSAAPIAAAAMITATSGSTEPAVSAQTPAATIAAPAGAAAISRRGRPRRARVRRGSAGAFRAAAQVTARAPLAAIGRVSSGIQPSMPTRCPAAARSVVTTIPKRTRGRSTGTARAIAAKASARPASAGVSAKRRRGWDRGSSLAGGRLPSSVVGPSADSFLGVRDGGVYRPLALAGALGA